VVAPIVAGGKAMKGRAVLLKVVGTGGQEELFS
jgi:hypothetical protein